MGINYRKLFKLMNEKRLKKTDLKEILSSQTIAKLSKNEYISGESIAKICIYLNCQPGEIMEIEEEKNNQIIDKFEIYELNSDSKKPERNIATFYNLEYAKDFINYQATLKKSFVILQNGEQI